MTNLVTRETKELVALVLEMTEAETKQTGLSLYVFFKTGLLNVAWPLAPAAQLCRVRHKIPRLVFKVRF